MPDRRKIGFIEAFSIGVGGMIGGGIFAVLGLSLQLAGTAAPVAFLLAGLVALATSYSYAKLSIRYPSEGGTIEYIVRAFGRGILAGGLNIMLLTSYIVMIALYAYAFGSYAASLFGEAVLLRHVFIALAIAIFTFLNALGAVVTGRVEDALVFFKLAILVVVAGAGLGFVEWGRFSPSQWPSLVNIVAGGMIIFLAYEGFELIANAAADVEDPRVLPRAFFAAVLVVTAIYVMVALVAAGTLSPEEVMRARDYALAEAAKPALGELGFGIVVAAALASTSSAINATLYGTARISYMVAKYGQLPASVGRRIWRQAPEGLAIISLLSLVLAEAASLEAISTAGSAGFLLIFTAVNVAALRLRREARVNPLVAGAGALATVMALALLIYRTATLDPRQVTVFILLLAGSFTVEYVYRVLTGREIAEYIDYKLHLREENIRNWATWVPRIVAVIVRRFHDAKVYLVGSVARGELHRAHDVDVLVVTSRTPRTRREAEEEARRIREEAGLTPQHPLHIHFARPGEEKRWLEHSRRWHYLYTSKEDKGTPSQ
ncbi:amino acid:proton symporter, ABT family [Pyrodictium delaneyi]|uniref:Amino acid:proton symporter, ABT family n=2 Tax=Pyrodictium delaneyi TaxID=1273541 RepID=A0A0P0N1A7_9CREN|nr:amino acid permease [Pyrodictium delaneyi]ALL00304.1 amino acid:proton symporter, ABT family [Pyrodictium delaneyi]